MKKKSKDWRGPTGVERIWLKSIDELGAGRKNNNLQEIKLKKRGRECARMASKPQNDRGLGRLKPGERVKLHKL